MTTLRDMSTAPRDGTEINVLVRHQNWDFEKPGNRDQWEQMVVAKWIDHNGGGWTWNGLCGALIGWRPIDKKRMFA